LIGYQDKDEKEGVSPPLKGGIEEESKKAVIRPLSVIFYRNGEN
jgi:hypothetical protein